MSIIYPTGTHTTSSGQFSSGQFSSGQFTASTVSMQPFTTFATTVVFDWQQNTDTTLLDDFSALATRWQDPEHFFEEDKDGSCSLCEQGNVHRFSEATHPLVINEEPDAEDWQQLLAS